MSRATSSMRSAPPIRKCSSSARSRSGRFGPEASERIAMTSEEIFLERSRYYLANEYLSKIRQCIAALPEGAVWARPNESSNSIANLLLHLAGNIRQWIGGGIGGREVMRDRTAEFSARAGRSATDLLHDLESAVAEVDAVLA